MYFRKMNAVLVISLFVLVFVTMQCFAKSETTQSIKVAIGSNCYCGSHYGECDAVYNGRKMSIDFKHNSNKANPYKHPIKVFRGKSEVKDWEELLCPSAPRPSKVTLTGSEVTIKGQLKNKTTFEAYEIYIMP